MLGLLILCLALGVTTAGRASSPCCGFANRGTRIVGGVETEVREYPWQAGIVPYNRSFIFCGGSVINDRYVLTASHCMANQQPENIEVLLGEHDKTVSDDEQRHDVSEIMMHPSYNGSTFDFDFALIKLSSPIIFADNQIAPACLARTGRFQDVVAVVTGWGATSEGGSLASALQEVTVNTMTNSACRDSYRDITGRMLCAGVSGGGKDSCQGDSGGPLVAEIAQNRYQQIGVVSWGYGCARPEYPGVYARVTKAYDWIMENTADASLC